MHAYISSADRDLCDVKKMRTIRVHLSLFIVPKCST